jgi:hypothetical protein
MIWAGAALVAAALIVPFSRTRELIRRHLGFWIGCCVILTALTGYYFYTLTMGAGASDANVTDARNLAFAAYELLGFTGLGPGRLAIRSEGVAAFRPFAGPLLVYGALLLSILAFGASHAIRTVPRRVWFGVLLAAATVVALLTVAGIAKHFRILGRHFTPMLPLILWCMAAGISASWRWKPPWGRIVATMFVVASLASCLSIRFAPRHAKDDYRGAAAFAREALDRGEVVWWNADKSGGRIYGLPLNTASQADATDAAWLVFNYGEETLSTQPVPDLIVASKPDLFDQSDAVREYLARGGYTNVATLPAFRIWRRVAPVDP